MGKNVSFVLYYSTPSFSLGRNAKATAAHQQQKEPPDRQTREEEITRTVAGVAITIRQFQRATHHHCWQRHSSQPPSSYSSCSDMSHSHHKCLSISLHTHTSEILKNSKSIFCFPQTNLSVYVLFCTAFV